MKKINIALLMITRNRLGYTKKALMHLLRYNRTSNFHLYIVDNASTDGTRQYLESLGDPRVKITFNSSNRSLSSITNEFWTSTIDKYVYVGKVDNDTLVSREWLPRVLAVHEATNQVGAIGGFAFNIYEDWDFEKSKRNVIEINGQRILAQPYIGGCSYLIKASLVKEIGFLADNATINKDGRIIKRMIWGWTEWQEEAYRRGYVHGYPFPLQIVEHMDDPLSLHCLLDIDPLATDLAVRNAEQRGLEYSRANVNKWIRDNGNRLFTKYIYRGNVGKRVYGD